MLQASRTPSFISHKLPPSLPSLLDCFVMPPTLSLTPYLESCVTSCISSLLQAEVVFALLTHLMHLSLRYSFLQLLASHYCSSFYLSLPCYQHFPSFLPSPILYFFENSDSVCTILPCFPLPEILYLSHFNTNSV